MKKVITPKSEKFLEAYLNNPSPTGFESEGKVMSFIVMVLITLFVFTLSYVKL